MKSMFFLISVSWNLNIMRPLRWTDLCSHALVSHKWEQNKSQRTKLLQLLTEYTKGFDSCRRKETENVIFALVLLDMVSALTCVFMNRGIKQKLSMWEGIFIVECLFYSSLPFSTSHYSEGVFVESHWRFWMSEYTTLYIHIACAHFKLCYSYLILQMYLLVVTVAKCNFVQQILNNPYFSVFVRFTVCVIWSYIVSNIFMYTTPTHSISGNYVLTCYAIYVQCQQSKPIQEVGI